MERVIATVFILAMTILAIAATYVFWAVPLQLVVGFVAAVVELLAPTNILETAFAVTLGLMIIALVVTLMCWQISKGAREVAKGDK
jgi:hypothetical protein